MTGAAPTLVWLRRDLRLDDNPALAEAARRGPVIPVFVLDAQAGRPLGEASRWWLHRSLAALSARLDRLGAPLVLARGATDAELARLAAASGATAIAWNRDWEPSQQALERKVAALGLRCHVHGANLLAEPGSLRTKSGGAFQVFTPFWRNLQPRPPAPPLPAPARLEPPPAPAPTLSLEQLDLLPTPAWWHGLDACWVPGEDGALDRWHGWHGQPQAQAGLDNYAERRDLPSVDATSRLSPHLAWGEVSVRRLWHALDGRPGAEPFLRQLAWRDFSLHLLHGFPDLPRHPLRPDFAAFPWRDDPDGLAAWQQGRTGFPLVDAGMRQLWQTGWMHNRVRMVVASFLIKDLLLPWQRGEEWFWDTLVDAEPANNAASWQWVAGSGADAAPYFRVFNPVGQGEKFDPDGAYVRRWCPELSGLSDRVIHRPWEASPLELAAAGVRLGRTYPAPCLNHADARQRALDAYARMRQDAADGSVPVVLR